MSQVRGVSEAIIFFMDVKDHGEIIRVIDRLGVCRIDIP